MAPWQSREGRSPRTRALCEFLGCELPHLFCGNSYPSNSHSASHRGEAETAVADFTSHPPPSKPSYLEGVLKFDCIEVKPRQMWQISPVDPPPSKPSLFEGGLKFEYWMISDSGVTRTMLVAGESRTGQSVLLESPEPRLSVVLR